MLNKSTSLLKKYFGYDSFRAGQYEIIENILNQKDTVGVMPTGGGKSICYQIPALIFEGVTIVVSPLISLMKDQVDGLNAIGIDSTYINSSLSAKELNSRIYNIINNKYKIIYIAPERLLSDYFLNILDNIVISFIAIDESHCVSQWGHDFRKSYLEIPRFIANLSPRPVVGAFTATATPEVRVDISKRLELSNPVEFINGFDRDNLHFSIIKGEDSKKYVRKYIEKNPTQSGIIYASTRKEVDALYEDLKRRGYSVGKYHAGLNEQEKRTYQEDFIYDKISIMVATNAFGMGIDKSNVRYVIHNNIPKDIESYYQEAGRAGRDGEDSECILIFNPKDIITQRFFIENNEFSISQSIIDIKYEKLNKMVNYCHTSTCLRKYLLEYFGETDIGDNCDNCGNCDEDDEEKVDMTIEAKKIISCVGRVKGAYGANMIANILGGSKNKKLLQNGLDKISTYGILGEHSMKDIKDMINLLIGDEYLELTNGEYPLLKHTSKALAFLKSDELIFRKVVKIESAYIADDGLLKDLKELRRSIAQKEKVPPYIIFSDKTLNEMVKFLPNTVENMLDIKGVGEIKFKKYGKPFLNLITEYRKLNEPTEVKIKTKETTKSKVPSQLITYEMYSTGKNPKEIAEERNISEQTVMTHLLDQALEGNHINFYDFFNEIEEKTVLNAIEKVGHEKLKPIKEALPDNISYNQIKAVICKNFLS